MLLVSDSLICVSSIYSALLEYNCLLKNIISNSKLNGARAHRTFQSPRRKLWIKRNQNFTGRLQAHRTFWSPHSKLRIKWNHSTEPSRDHAANSELNRTKAHRIFWRPSSKLWIKRNQNSPGGSRSQNLRESTTLPSPPRLGLRLSPSLGRTVLAPLSWQAGCSGTPLRLPGRKLLRRSWFAWLPLPIAGWNLICLLLVDRVGVHWNHLDLVESAKP